jgi:hypothetical protein
VGPAGADVPDGRLTVDGGDRVVVWRTSAERPDWAGF